MRFIYDAYNSKKDVGLFSRNGDHKQGYYWLHVVKSENKNSNIKIVDGKYYLYRGKKRNKKAAINFVSYGLRGHTRKKQYERTINLVDLKKQEFYFLGNKYQYRIYNYVLFFNIGKMPHVIKILNHDLIEEKLKDALSKLYLKYLRERQTYGEGIMDIPEHSIAIRRKRATGACNRVNSKRITYNYYTIAAEIDALDYLIVHELTHHRSHRHNKFFGNHVA